ncbi:ATP-binding cassette domain-containing protein, partial [Rhizobium ruizarguesonis]
MKDHRDLLAVDGAALFLRVLQEILTTIENLPAGNPGQTLAILGESGSGKSVSASEVLDLVDSPPAVIASGQILYSGQDLLKSSKEERR